MMELLRLSESRAALVGGVAVDTLCVGTLVLSVVNPSMFEQGHAGIIVLLSLAITSPVLASTAVFLSLVVPSRFDIEERARRSLMSATVLHGGVQMSTVLVMLCSGGPVTVAGYFLTVWLLTTLLAVVLVPLAMIIRKGRKAPSADSSVSPPSKL